MAQAREAYQAACRDAAGKQRGLQRWLIFQSACVCFGLLVMFFGKITHTTSELPLAALVLVYLLPAPVQHLHLFEEARLQCQELKVEGLRRWGDKFD